MPVHPESIEYSLGDWQHCHKTFTKMCLPTIKMSDIATLYDV